MYPEADAAARLAMQKGGIADSSEAPMALGQALTAQKKYDDAVAAFGQVNGGGAASVMSKGRQRPLQECRVVVVVAGHDAGRDLVGRARLTNVLGIAGAWMWPI